MNFLENNNLVMLLQAKQAESKLTEYDPFGRQD